MTLTLSTTEEQVFARLRDQPWRALERVGALLRHPVGEVLAGERAERVLDRWMRANSPLSPEERRVSAELIFGVALWRRRLAWHVGERGPEWSVFSFLRDLAGQDPADSGRWAGISVGDAPDLRPPPEDLGQKWSLPDWVLEALRDQVPAEELELLLASFNLPGPITFRVNTSLASVEQVQTSLLESGTPTSPARFAPNALSVEMGTRPNIYGLEPYQRGWFEVQDEGSQLLGLLLGAKPGETVLDLCAGAGGKTLLLASEVQNSGKVLAFDTDLSRLERLRHRALKAQATCVRVLLPPSLPPGLQVDRVLVDAPCSELGALRRGPDLRFALDPRSFDTVPRLQGELLDTAVSVLKPGGTLVYATCTLRREENQDVARAFEARHSNLQRVRPGEGWLPESFVVDGYFQSFPHRHGADGFFAAVYRRAP